jgi:hypothetical protein
MYATQDKTTFSGSEQTANSTHPAERNVVAAWAGGRSRITPWAYPYMRALGVVRLAVGLFLVGLGAVLTAHGDAGIAAIPFVGAVLNLGIGSMDTAAARFAHRHA